MTLDIHRVDVSAATVEHAPAAADYFMGTFSKSHPVARRGISWRGFLAWAAVLLAFVAFNYYAIGHLYARDTRVFDSATGRENGLLEIIQLMTLVPALALFWFAGLRGFGTVRIAGAVLAMITTIVLVREFDLSEPGGVGTWFGRLWDHGFQDGVQTIFGLAIVLFLSLKRQYFLNLLRLGMRWQAWPFIASTLLLATAQFYIEELPYDTSGHFGAFRFWELRFWEELVEANGYFLLALAAWQHSRLIGDPEFGSPVKAGGNA